MRTPPHPRLRLSLASALVAGLVGAFAALALAVAAGNAALAECDARMGELLGRRADEPVGAVLSWMSALHAPRGIVVLTALAAAALWFWRERTGVVVLLASVSGGAWINHALKHGFQRPRPGLEQAVAAVTDFSFPSGHVANATLLYGTLAALIALRTASRPVCLAAGAAAVLMVVCIAWSRVALGAHHFSDAVAGVLVGMAWMTVCLALRDVLSRSDRSGR